MTTGDAPVPAGVHPRNGPRIGCRAVNMGAVGYVEAWELQKTVAQQVGAGTAPPTLLLMEHPHVYTVGRRGDASHILASSDTLARLGASVHYVDRGGEATYHGPGQLVGYPILNLRASFAGPTSYVDALKRAISRTLAEFGVTAETHGRPTGVWAGEAKIAAIGVRVSRGITTHGFALNVDPDLSYFDHIVPCGMPGCAVTSIAAERGAAIGVDEVVPVLAEQFGLACGFEIDWVAAPAFRSEVSGS